MNIEKIFVFVLAVVLAFAFCACGSEIENPKELHSEPEVPVEESSEPKIPQEPETEPEKTPEEIAKACGYMSFEEITVAGYYPDWMQPHTIIIYDENGNPEIIEGGELLPEDLVGRPEFEVMPFFQSSEEMKIEPNTKVEYDLHGFIQNIYHLWPDGNYNLDYPPEEG